MPGKQVLAEVIWDYSGHRSPVVRPPRLVTSSRASSTSSTVTSGWMLTFPAFGAESFKNCRRIPRT
ncbi:MAG TPA: hypothetical protein VMB74_15040 [Streptosporangiaceae bacterium]|nr:hypothetical protein [Streptosporangiaceae bacterium]